MTYENEKGETTQEDVKLPWRFTFTPSGTFLYISADAGGHGAHPPRVTVTVNIYLDGKLLKTSVSSGDFVMVFASASL